jgi:hypothetical protein
MLGNETVVARARALLTWGFGIFWPARPRTLRPAGHPVTVGPPTGERAKRHGSRWSAPLDERPWPVALGLLGFAWADGDGMTRHPPQAPASRGFGVHPRARGPRRRHEIWQFLAAIPCLESLSRQHALAQSPAHRGGSARQGRTPGASAAGAAARSAVALIQYGSTRQCLI